MNIKRSVKKQSVALALLMALLPFAAQAQETVPQDAVATAGATISTAAGTMCSYTVGQTAFAFFGNDATVEEGVQQVFCIPTFSNKEYEVCENDPSAFLSLLPAGYTLPDEVQPTIPGEYQFLLNTISIGGCDSVVLIKLRVHPVRDTDLYVQGENNYYWPDMKRTYTESGSYDTTIRTIHGCDSLINIHVSIINDVPIPVIYHYLGRVLMVNHHPEGREPAYYHYYRWYRDGQLIAQGDSLDNYRNEDDSELNGCYYVEVATAPDTHYWVRSDTICIGTTGIAVAQDDPINLTLMPNPVAAGNVVRISVSLAETQLQGAKVTVYDAQGRKVIERAAMQQTSIMANFAAGVYSVHIILPNGTHSARKLVVR